MTDLDDRLRLASRAATRWVVGHPRVAPADEFATLAKAAVDLGIEEWDGYGDRGPVEMLERQVAELLGKPAAVFFASGVTAQQVMLRIWCDRAASLRVPADVPGTAFTEVTILSGALDFEPAQVADWFAGLAVPPLA